MLPQSISSVYPDRLFPAERVRSADSTGFVEVAYFSILFAFAPLSLARSSFTQERAHPRARLCVRGWSRDCLPCRFKGLRGSGGCIGAEGCIAEGIAMLGMFNTGATTRHGEMAGFSHGINLAESYLPSRHFLSASRRPVENFSGGCRREDAYCAPM